MMRISGLILLWLLCAGVIAHGQEVPPQDSLRRELPPLEIPEITIVGKKAITLPFARKGEIYDVNIYEASQADTGLLMDRPAAPLPVGSLPRYQQREMPWRASLEGSFGSFATGNADAYVDYKSQRWGIAGHGGFGSTNGHAGNSNGRATRLGLNYHSLVKTDNDILRTFRVNFGADYMRETYGMFGSTDTLTERRRNHFDFHGKLATIQRAGVVLDARLGVKLWKITDSQIAGDSDVSVASPTLSTMFASDIGSLRFLGDLSYTSSSLDYNRAAESPSLLSFSGGFRWTIQNKFLIQLGAMYAGGSDSQGGNKTLVAPTGLIKWDLNPGQTLGLWFRPEILLRTYDDEITRNPYLVQDLELRPERKPINFGGSLWYNNGIVTMEVRGSFSKSSNHAITLADSGRIKLEYVDALQTVLEGEGSLKPTANTRLTFTGTLQPSTEDGSTTQLPMTPLVKIVGRGELELTRPFIIWSSLEYQSKRNVDRQGTNTLGDLVLLGAGASTSIIPRTMLTLEISNLLNTAYEWWSGYVAPGRRIMAGAKIGLQ